MSSFSVVGISGVANRSTVFTFTFFRFQERALPGLGHVRRISESSLVWPTHSGGLWVCTRPAEEHTAASTISSAEQHTPAGETRPSRSVLPRLPRIHHYSVINKRFSSSANKAESDKGNTRLLFRVVMFNERIVLNIKMYFSPVN